MLLAGSGRAEVDLTDVLPFDGFDTCRHPLAVRALVLEAGERVAIVSVEATSLRGSFLKELRCESARILGVPQGNVWVCATHTFSVPHVRTPEHLSGEGERERNVRLAAAYRDAVRQALAGALAALAPASLAFGVGQTDVNVNRDVETPAGWWLGANPDGFSDHGVRVIGVSDAQGRPLAVLFSADVQSSVLDGSRLADGSRLVGGDLAGFACAALERAHPGCTALFLLGCAADQAPREQAVTREVLPDGSVVPHDAHEQGLRMLHRQGQALADAVMGALASASPLPCGAVAAEESMLDLPAQRRRDFAALGPRRTYAFEPAGTTQTTVRLLRLGERVLVGLEPEVSSAFGARLRAQSPALLDVCTMVSGAAKYLPDADAYHKVTYEAQNSGFAEGAAERLQAAVLDVINNPHID